MAEATDPTALLDLLLVDDSEVDRILVRRLLTRPYRIREASTAREARALFAAAEPNLILLDHRLPDADGIDLLPEFVAHHVPVIMLTGMEEPEMIVGAMQRGAHDYLPKGRLTEEGLEHAIGNAVEKAALRRAVDEQQRALAEHAMELEEKNREVRALASALTLAEQAERRRVSDLLHDNIQQLLFGAKLTLGLLHQSASDTTADSAAFRTHLEEAEQILDEAIDTTRHLAVELTPPVLDREDVAVALRWLAEHMSTMYRVSIDVVTECSCHIPSRELRILVIQIVRELLFNVVKHAGVEEARLRLMGCDGSSTIVVEDEGCGFDAAAWSAARSDNGGGFGLYSVRRRLELVGGGLRVESEPGGGCRVILNVPFEWSVEQEGGPRHGGEALDG